VADLGQRICISNLNEHESWLPLVALWHHDEWLRTHSGLEGRGRSPEVIEKKLCERRHALSRHLGEEPLPTTFVAHWAGDPIGTVSLVYYQFTHDQNPTEWLTNLFVLPEYRRRGVASHLLNSAIAYASSHDLHRLLLYTNDQVDFYRKRHWRPLNRGLVQGEKVEIMDYVLRRSSPGISHQ